MRGLLPARRQQVWVLQVRQHTCTPCLLQAAPARGGQKSSNCSHRPLPTVFACASHLMAQAAHGQGFGSSPRAEAWGGSSALAQFSSLTVTQAALCRGTCRLLLQVQPAERQMLREADRAGVGYGPIDIVIVSTSFFFFLPVVFWLSLPRLFIAAWLFPTMAERKHLKRGQRKCAYPCSHQQLPVQPLQLAR